MSRPQIPKVDLLKYSDQLNVSRNLTQKDQILELQGRILDLLRQLEDEHKKTLHIQQQAEHREQRFARKEVEFRKALKRYEDLFRELSSSDGGALGDLTVKNLERISAMYKQIQSGLNDFQDKRAEDLLKHETGMLQQFSQRLKEAEAHVEGEKQLKLKQLGLKADQDLKQWAQMEMTKASVVVIEQRNTELERMNKDLRIKCSLLQDEAKLLVSKNYSLIKQTDRQLDTQLSTSALPLHFRRSTTIDKPALNLTDDKIVNRQGRIMAKLRRSLELERSRVSAARSSFTQELALKQDLRGLIKHCCDEVYHELMIASEDMSTSLQIRTAVIKTLENQLRMLTLIYDRAFPTSESKL
jgi:hypothetical protein